jgi:maltose alpha-D-glucosyltransferase/alpha-amylase
MRGLSRRVFRLMRGQLKQLPDEIRGDAQTVLSLEQDIVDWFQRLVGRKFTGTRIRCHGDYHLGQVLYTGKDFVIIDFEGEPQRRISERRIKRSPLRDVAGMLRSFDYAAQSVLLNHVSGMLSTEEMAIFRQWADFWSMWTGARFLRGYFERLGDAPFIPASRKETELLLDTFLLEKALYEIGYELNNRPAWVQVPLQGILRMMQARN